ncbi:alanine racemase [Candidatus Peregrinibacteria bacterium]|nr:alanine racemase [Candidatus Peregrinibacteria bacterium]
MYNSLTWVEISKANLLHNVGVLRGLIGDDQILCSAVKSNAYGHGMTTVAPIMKEAGTNWFGVNSLSEAVELYECGIDAPIYIMGYIPLDELEEVVLRGFHFVVYNKETFVRLREIVTSTGEVAHTHLKLETGNNRQGVVADDLEWFIDMYKGDKGLVLEGLATHFANIEDTTDHSYALLQLEKFEKMVSSARAAGLEPNYIHCANSAATILFPKTYFNFVRAGLSNYGMWPSNETLVSSLQEGRRIEFKPVLSWKTRIAQIKRVPAGSFVGYGCTFKTTHDSLLAVLPIGYYDGYDRMLSNNSYVLIDGKRAPVRGRVAMNMTMVDVTDIPTASLEKEVTLLGVEGDEKISAEQLAQFSETINYEVTTRINDRIERRLVDS